MRCSDLRTEKFVDLKHYAMHNKIYKQKICLNKSILHASVSSAANNLKKFLTLVYLGKRDLDKSVFQVLSYNRTKVSCPGSCFFWTLLSSESLEKGKFQSQRDLHFSPKFKDSSFNNSNIFIFNLNQQDGFIYM